MTPLSAENLVRLVPRCGKIVIGYSGGIDSHTLLHLCASVSTLKHRVLAVYIHHGLQAAADSWGQHCRRQCADLGVAFDMIKVDAKAHHGESPEAAARDARYAVFRKLLESDDVLLLAQHREDQMETLLLQLFRGSGVKGLAAMPVWARLGRGRLLRPLLDVAKQDIQDYAARHGLVWVDDPSNFHDDFDRNFLRNQVVPLLKQRWPSLDKTVGRSAKHCGETMHLVDEWADQALDCVVDGSDQSLSIRKWREFDEYQRSWLLRRWLALFGLRPPSQAVMRAIIDQLISAHDAANPQIAIQGFLIRRYRHKLFCISRDYSLPAPDIQHWHKTAPELQLANGYALTRSPSANGIPRRLWDTHEVTVVRRRGGEKIKLPGREGRHCLKKLYQEAGIPPWEREVRPLIYLNDRLAAVAGLWVDEWAWGQGDCYRLSWNRDRVSMKKIEGE